VTVALPAIVISAPPGRREKTLDLVKRAEAAGFAGIYSTFLGDVMGFCTSLCHVTEGVTFGSAIQPIYARPAVELARSASYIAELSEGRFRLGLGVSVGPVLDSLGVRRPVSPLKDMREYVATLKDAIGDAARPPIYLAALRRNMLSLAVEVADGAISANAPLSHFADNLANLPRREDFTVATIIPTVIDADRDAARDVLRRGLARYLTYSSYRAYWREAGYVDEMAAAVAAVEAGDFNVLPSLLTERLLDDITLTGTAEDVRIGVEKWKAAGVNHPILAPSSTTGGQAKAVAELIEAYS
jgi:alkanesulfonate monooxygenase SsuD/methylene tetrahydromethanopterin reductase-like flavin-dependent oxidoreductase (luciferase family)